ncbi:MAG TPA: hypothetical protein VIK86_09160 [Candidatus Paceibacterota bacterium]
MNKKIVSSVAVCLIIAGVSFWGGMTYGSSKSSSNQLANRIQNGLGQNGGTRIGGGMRGGATGGGFVNGEILTKDATSITVKENNGGSKIIFYSPSTKIEKTVEGTSTDLIIGKQVMVTGTTNSDGSVSASSIQLRPIPIKDTQVKQ